MLLSNPMHGGNRGLLSIGKAVEGYLIWCVRPDLGLHIMQGLSNPM